MRFLLLSTLAVSLLACADPAPPPPQDETNSGRILARIGGIRNDKGHVIARLYHGADGFSSDASKAYREAKFEIRGGAAVVTFADVPYGEYAIWIHHDEDEDGELKSNFIGMPKEGVGVSGPPPSFIPTYKEARFELNGPELTFEIALRYL